MTLLGSAALGLFCFLVVLLLLFLRVKLWENEKVAFERILAHNGKCLHFVSKIISRVWWPFDCPVADGPLYSSQDVLSERAPPCVTVQISS